MCQLNLVFVKNLKNKEILKNNEYNSCNGIIAIKKELFSQEDNDTIYVNDKGELIGI